MRPWLRRSAMAIDNLRYAFGSGKPQLVAKLTRNHLLARLGMQPTRSLCVAVSYRCNLTCSHCSARSLEDRARPPMTLDQYAVLADQVERLGFFNIQFTGGEPLLRTDLETIIARFHPRRNFILVSTNATLLDADRIKRLKDAGVDVLSVSLDSSDESVHDAFRGMRGAWGRTLHAVKLALRSGMKVSLSTVVTHQNVRSADLEALARLTRSLGCGMQLNWACPVGAWAGNREARLSEEDMRELFAFLERHHHARTDFDGNYRHRGCPAVKEMMYLTVQGDFLPCAFIPISYGNVTEEPLEVVRQRALQDPTYQRYWNRCLSANNDTFYENYLRPTFGSRSPLPSERLSGPAFA